MKVIKASVDLAKWNLPVICPKCKSELEVESKDISYDHEVGGGGVSYRAICCLCGGMITMADTQIPEIVKTDVTKNRYISHGSAWD
jgi:hypothetical protein